MNSIYQIKIILDDVKPPIWRRIIVNSDTSLEDFHKIIQTTMGWTNNHLHQFVKENYFYSNYDDLDDIFESMSKNVQIDYTDMVISDLLKKENAKIKYDYDFGDGWQHTILLETIKKNSIKIAYPKCVKGKRACPIEDCGGVYGYENLIEIMNNPKHPEYKGMLEWIGDYFEPEEFDIDIVNELLEDDDFGCDDMF